ncbi:MAG: hypothetical protein MK101_08870 [Phycisphaerales bacterium]|nr:hypothetical protein [Phycisphaerales bacterium]
MSVPSPLRDLIEAEGARGVQTPQTAHRPGAATGVRPPLEPEWIPWGPALPEGVQPQLLATTGTIELEYAAIRRGAGRLDAAHRATIELSGADRLDLLDRLLTQKVVDLPVGRAIEAFLLERTGRLIGDMVVVHADAVTLLDVDLHQAPIVAQTLEAMCFGEDVTISEQWDHWHGIDLHGPAAVALAEAIGLGVGGCLEATQEGAAHGWRLDRLGVPGLSLRMPASAAEATWEAIESAATAMGITMRTVGWYAFNMARVEASEPMANIDFGPGNLPAETGVLHRRVSFTKGCYPGQEVVARMFNLGHPKQVLRRLVFEDGPLPVAGAQVFGQDDADLATPRGLVTSSAPAPLSGGGPVAMAMVRWAIATEGTQVRLSVDGTSVSARVEAIEDPAAS